MDIPNAVVRLVRRLAGLKGSACPVLIVAGSRPPTRRGEPGHSTFKNGGACYAPAAAMRAGYKVRYVRSTLRVEVGDEWLAALEWPGALYRRCGLPEDCGMPLPVLCDYAEDHCGITLDRNLLAPAGVSKGPK